MRTLSKERALTAREKKFVKYFCESGKIGDAALRAGYNQGKYGTFLKGQERIQLAIEDKMKRIGLTDTMALRTLKQGIKAMTPPRYAKALPGQEPQILIPESPDHMNRPRYLDIYFKVTKRYAPEGTTTQNKVTMIQINLTEERVKGLLDSGAITDAEVEEIKELKHEPIRDGSGNNHEAEG